MWAAWELLERGRQRGAAGGAASAATGRAGATAGSASRCGCRRPSLRERFGDEPARALLDASSDTVSKVGAWCAAEGVDAWFDQSGYMCVSTAPAFDEVGRGRGRGRGGAGGARAGGGAVRGGGARRAAPRRASAAAVLIPDFATLQPGAPGARPAPAADRARRAGLRALAACAALGPAGARPTPAACSAGAVVLAVGPAARAQPRLRIAPHRHLVAHRADRARARRDRRARLDRRRVHDRRPHARPLLPHHARRAHPARLGRRAAGLRRARERARGDRSGAAARAAHAALVRLFPGAEGRRITHAWGGPIDVSPSHIPQIGTLPGKPVHFAFGFTGNGVGPTNLVGRTLAVARDRGGRRAHPPAAGGRRRRRLGPAGAAHLAGRLARAQRAGAPRAHRGGRAAGPTRSRAPSARRRGLSGCTWRAIGLASHRERLHLPRLHPPAPGPRGARRPPAARPVHRVRLPGAHGGPHAAGRHRRLEPEDRRDGRPAARVELDAVPPAPAGGRPLRHPLRDQVVEARHQLRGASRSTRCSRGSSRRAPTRWPTPTAATRPTSRSPT